MALIWFPACRLTPLCGRHVQTQPLLPSIFVQAMRFNGAETATHGTDGEAADFCFVMYCGVGNTSQPGLLNGSVSLARLLMPESLNLSHKEHAINNVCVGY